MFERIAWPDGRHFQVDTSYTFCNVITPEMLENAIKNDLVAIDESSKRLDVIEESLKNKMVLSDCIWDYCLIMRPEEDNGHKRRLKLFYKNMFCPRVYTCMMKRPCESRLVNGPCWKYTTNCDSCGVNRIANYEQPVFDPPIISDHSQPHLHLDQDVHQHGFGVVGVHDQRLHAHPSHLEDQPLEGSQL